MKVFEFNGITVKLPFLHYQWSQAFEANSLFYISQKMNKPLCQFFTVSVQTHNEWDFFWEHFEMVNREGNEECVYLTQYFNAPIEQWREVRSKFLKAIIKTYGVHNPVSAVFTS